MKPLMPFVFAALLVAMPAAAQESGGMDHSAMGHGDMTDMDSPASQAFMAAMGGMRKSMDAMRMTGDPDLDFLQGMIPHHEGAIAMAKVELQYGKNAKAKTLARRIIEDQEAEIAEMKRMIAAHGKAAK